MRLNCGEGNGVFLARRTSQSIDRIDRGYRHREERPVKRHIPRRAIHGRYLWERSVMFHWRSIPRDNIARTKSLEITTLRAVRSIR